MDKALFIKKLRGIFAEINSEGIRYSQVWLSDEDLGGLYYSGKYDLKLRALHPIERYQTEVRFLIDLLREKLDKEMSYVCNMRIYREHEFARPEYGDIILYTDELAYNAA